MAKKTYLMRYGELGLKGLNRTYFLKVLKKNILKALTGFQASIRMPHGRLFLETTADENLVSRVLAKTFGLVGFAPVRVVDLDYKTITDCANDMFADIATDKAYSFKVETRRSNKSFPLNSMETNKELGAFILNQFPNLRVDVHSPDFKLNVELRERAYLYLNDRPGPGGLPVGTGGKGLLMLSGGIDSPVAGWMLLKRGMSVQPVHFHSPPYTSERSLAKVKEITSILKKWGLQGPLLVVNFTPLQEVFLKSDDKDYLTLFMRRAMVRIADVLRSNQSGHCLITGESLGQVASQTVEALHVTGEPATVPIFRPLIGLNKDEITNIAKNIGTYETSIIPYEDCCQVFVPSRPITKPKLKIVETKESLLEINNLVDRAVADVEKFAL